jgi:hypothetical protein
MKLLSDWQALSLEVREDRRQGKRVPLALPIEVSGFDRTARLFFERTMTLDVSEAGCRFQLKTPLERGDMVAIRLLSGQKDEPSAGKPVLFQIMWSIREPEGWTVGALRLQPENIWHVALPSSESPESSTA